MSVGREATANRSTNKNLSCIRTTQHLKTNQKIHLCLPEALEDDNLDLKYKYREE